MNILFVDDEQPILDMVENYFSYKEHKVFLAHDGLEALEVLKNHKIDCCFTDLNMPKMNGVEFAQEAQDLDNSIPIIVLTGYPSLDATIGTLKSGVVDFLIKPVQLKQMEIAMQTVMRRREVYMENAMLKKELENKAQLEKLHIELKEKVKDLNTFNVIIESLESARSVGDIFRKASELAVKITGAQSSFVFVGGLDGQPPACISQSPDEDVEKLPGGTRIKDHIASWLADFDYERLPVNIFGKNGVQSLPGPIVGIAAAPISMNHKPFGVIAAASFEENWKISQRSMDYLFFAAEKTGLTVENFGLYENIYDNLFSTLYAFVETLEARDSYTRRHSFRVTRIAELLAEQMGVSSVEMEVLRVAGNLHDIGKIGIPDSVLLKPGKLTDEEFDMIKRHPDIGAGIVGFMGLWDTEKEIIRHHHEKWDGSGYPMKLKGEDIPFLSRILAVADVYDAVTTNRAYRKRLPEEVCRKIIKEGAGAHFDPAIVDAFFSLYDEGAIQDALLDEDGREEGALREEPSE